MTTSIEEIQSKPGRLVVIVIKTYIDGDGVCVMHQPWGIEARWDVNDWSGFVADRSRRVDFKTGTFGTDLKGPFLLPGMIAKPKAYPKPFLHLVLVGENKYYIPDVFLEDGYNYAKKHSISE